MQKNIVYPQLSIYNLHPAGAPSRLNIFPDNDFLENQVDATLKIQVRIIFSNNYSIIPS